MKNDNQPNLVILHHEEIFETRELALGYLQDWYRPNSIEAEPVIVKYGDERKPNVILAFGTTSTYPGNFYAIDMAKAEEDIQYLLDNVDGDMEELDYVSEVLRGVVEASGLTLDDNKIENKVTYEPDPRDAVIGQASTIAEAVDLLSKFAQNQAAGSGFNTEDSKSVKLIFSVDEQGVKTLKAKVKVSNDGDSDELTFNNNIIGVKADGIYAATSLSYDDLRNQLIYTTSGYKNGRYQDDAIVEKINLGKHTKLVADNEDKSVKLTLFENAEENVTTISGNVRLGSNESIVVRNGGLEANITVDVDTATNKLIVTIGNQRIEEQLPGVELFESAEYNDENEELIITFRTGNTLVIPIHGIIHTWETVNAESSPIVLTKTVVTGGVDTLSGNVKLRSTDNLIGIENGKLYVSEQGINNKVTAETTRATSAEQALSGQLENLSNTVSQQRTSLNALETTTQILTQRVSNDETRIEELADMIGQGSEQVLEDAKAYTDTKVTTEKTERQASDVELNTKIDTAKRDAFDEAAQKATQAKEQANAYTDGQIINEKQRAIAAETANANAITALTTEVGNKIESVEIVKDSQSDLQYTLKVDGQDVGEINIPKDQFLKSVTYDDGNKALVFVFETSEGTVTTTVSVNDLVDTYTAGDGLTLVDNKFAVRINEDSESYLTVSSEGIKLLGIDTKFASKADANSVYTKTEIDNKGYLTSQDITDLATVQSVEQLAQSVENVSDEVEDMKFVTNETDTVRMTMVKETGAETRVLSSDVKLKTISGENANIIKSDANGLYATVTFSYDKAANEITFNDGNGNKVFELNNFGILQDAFYDSENKNIVLIVKKDDETTERIAIPVSDLVNDWTVENAANSPVVLTKTSGAEGDVLSADISILNNANNLLVKENGSLFVDGDSNSHKALWGNEVTSVQGVINILWGAYNDIEEMKQDIVDLEEDNENIKTALASYQSDLNDQKERITDNENGIAALSDRTDTLEEEVELLKERANDFETRITEADSKATEALEKVNTIMGNIGDGTPLLERIERIEYVIEQLIDFGEYPISLNSPINEPNEDDEP